MLDMAQIKHIRDLGNAGYSISKIHNLTSVDRKTVRKYLGMEDFSPQIPLTTSRPSMLDPLKPVIDSWFESDKNNWYKQRHTAKQRANQELIWEPGTAQADFGEADFVENGMTTCKKFLVLSFPFSNDGYCQVFGGETAECVC